MSDQKKKNDPFEFNERPDRLSQSIRDLEELISDYATEKGEEGPLWRDFVIAGVQSLRLANKAWDLEFELGGLEEDLEKENRK